MVWLIVTVVFLSRSFAFTAGDNARATSDTTNIVAITLTRFMFYSPSRKLVNHLFRLVGIRRHKKSWFFYFSNLGFLDETRCSFPSHPLHAKSCLKEQSTYTKG